jgi:hypothetical protein
MLSFISNLLLPFALGVIRAYLYSPSSNNDGQILNVVKDSIQYLATKDNNTVSFGHVGSINSTVLFHNLEDFK